MLHRITPWVLIKEDGEAVDPGPVSCSGGVLNIKLHSRSGVEMLPAQHSNQPKLGMVKSKGVVDVQRWFVWALVCR